MKRLPLILKIAIVLTFFNSWVLFEETVIDRYGLWVYLPYYEVGRPCVWDLVALLIIIATVIFVLKGMRRQRAVGD